MNTKPLLITNAWICQVESESINPLFGDLVIENGIIISIKNHSSDKISYSSKEYEIINAGGKVVTIPNVNFHDHIYSRLAKGLPSTGSMENFPEILQNLWWKLDMFLDLDMIKASAYMAAIESIRNGVTYIFDHHSSPTCTKGSLKCIKEALQKFDIRNVLCFESSDRNGEQLKLESLKENKDFIRNNTDDNSKAMFGLHASFTLEDSTLQSVKDFIEKNYIGIHIHVCEDESDRNFSLQKYSKSPVQRLFDYNLVNEKSILVHGVHITKDEFNLLKNKKPAFAINLDSNLNNAVGTPMFENIPEEVSILCGTDGMHADIPQSQKQLFLSLRNQKNSFNDAFKIFSKMYFDQFQFVKKYFPDFSSIHTGDRGDLIIWDYVPPTPFTEENFFGHYIYGILERPIHTVLQNGKALMRDYTLNGIDEDNLNNYIYSQGKKLFDFFTIS